MSSIDATAYYDKDRLLSQHHAILTVLKGILDNPCLSQYKWLDIGCGKGQILANLNERLNATSMSKLLYNGYDIENDNTRTTRSIAADLKLKNRFEVGDIHNFDRIITEDEKFEFITLTNTVHEIDPRTLSNILYESIIRLEEKGHLFVYDMETLPIAEQELGAVTWKAHEILQIINTLLRSINVTAYTPSPGRWNHKSCHGWDVHLQREYFGVDNTLISAKKEDILYNVNVKIVELIDMKYLEIKNVLESFTDRAPQTKEDEEVRTRALYDFWALTRVKETVHT
ncbi:class I SAM-dependent methyltransferase [Paenibacillus plantarum]|nr:methyltransferase domain-containing protein [Paenibacillus plantarum]